eukprot:351773-Chlamydomonas_euryale.AAC.23
MIRQSRSQSDRERTREGCASVKRTQTGATKGGKKHTKGWRITSMVGGHHPHGGTFATQAFRNRLMEPMSAMPLPAIPKPVLHHII